MGRQVGRLQRTIAASVPRVASARYGTDEALQAAWRDSAVSLDSAELPAVEARTSATAGILRDPSKEQGVVDFYQYLSETMAGDILYFARIVKDATDGRSLAGAYYGYLTQHWIHQQDSAHLALAKVLESPDIDFLMSPPMYTGREIGGTSTLMTASASVKLHGKLWFNESDIRTHLSDPASDYGRVSNLAESRAVLLREFGEMLTRRTAISWFDMDGGWFSDPTLLADIAAMRKQADRAMEARKPFQAEMAVFISAESAYRMKPSALWMPAVLDQVVSLPRIGVPADVYLLSDLNRPDFPEYKVYVFLNAFYVDSAMRASVEGKVKHRRRHCGVGLRAGSGRGRGALHREHEVADGHQPCGRVRQGSAAAGEAPRRRSHRLEGGQWPDLLGRRPLS